MCIKNIVIVGKGGFAKEVKWLIDRINQNTKEWNFLGFIDQRADAENVVGDDDFVANMHEELSVVLAIGNSKLRNSIYKKYKENKHLNFPNLIDPSVKMSESIYLGEGNIICANNVLTVDIVLGSFNIINLNCTVGHDVNIGSFNTINPNVSISGNITLKNYIEVGTGTKIIQGKTVGDGVIIGAGSVVIHDISAENTVVGVPAKVIKCHKKSGKDE